MPAETILQLVTVILGVLGIIWHQQHSINKLRNETTGSINRLRDDSTSAIDKLRSAVARNGERIARIEGRLGIEAPQSELDGDDS